MLKQKLNSLLKKNFVFTPTEEQEVLIDKLSDFVSDINARGIFILKGYAGTGKTSIISALVKSLLPIGKKSSLLAPTGRAAKVLAGYSAKTALTIHKKIYWMRTNSKGNTYVKLQENKHTSTIFVVDEASMIPDQNDKGFGNRSLLDDLIEYVYSGINCKLILIGDTAQLPPIGLDISPALNEELLNSCYDKEVYVHELTQVIRQEKNSMILANATHIRDQIILETDTYPKLRFADDVIRVDAGDELQFALESAYSDGGFEDTVVICRSNKRANMYNRQIRFKIRWHEDEISAGDFLMIVRNNYYWLPEKSKAGFIANGDTIEILSVFETIERYGFRYARINARLVDYPDEPNIEVVILLDTLSSNNASMTYDEYKTLHAAVSKDYSHIKNTAQRNKELKENEFFNALQVKFAYAITCHKSQGGQWKHVFVEQGYFTDDMLNKEYLRWLYTAISRSTTKLYLVNFKERFFS